MTGEEANAEEEEDNWVENFPLSQENTHLY